MNHWHRNFILLTLMLAASGLAMALRPSHTPIEQMPKVNLEAVIPTAFANWREEKQPAAQIVDPVQQETIDRIYSNTLTRTYVNQHGERIMLSIAYGNQQDKQSQVHRPDVCYPSQGFSIGNATKENIATPYAHIPAQRLIATLGSRIEPITYWIRVGDSLASGWLGQKIAVTRQGLRGQVTDGLLFRVSSLTDNSQIAYSGHDVFIRNLLEATSAENRHLLIGRP